MQRKKFVRKDVSCFPSQRLSDVGERIDPLGLAMARGIPLPSPWVTQANSLSHCLSPASQVPQEFPLQSTMATNSQDPHGTTAQNKHILLALQKSQCDLWIQTEHRERTLLCDSQACERALLMGSEAKEKRLLTDSERRGATICLERGSVLQETEKRERAMWLDAESCERKIWQNTEARERALWQRGGRCAEAAVQRLKPQLWDVLQRCTVVRSTLQAHAARMRAVATLDRARNQEMRGALEEMPRVLQQCLMDCEHFFDRALGKLEGFEGRLCAVRTQVRTLAVQRQTMQTEHAVEV